ncbi:TonB-dependent receptor domain-containing protein [Sphingosinicella sp. CPCC 101087]|uniref:TonB-dependent receptor domain-containing protein n=1 Tax=Sphingosinicella sp. CPCC 101087 TaxID=2497754 RepID=UPI00101D628A|nr:TonB-dependent receptor [Sphingosinicella sp. CPCC 101087]
MTATRKLLGALLCSAAILGTAQPALAQDETGELPAGTGTADTARDGEAIIVTGSRIARRDLTSSSPLAVVQDEEFRLSGAVNVEQVINTLPQVVPGVTAFSNNPGGGVATVDLRGLGAQRTLVLVNGRRWVFFAPNQQVDLNTIPSFLIDSVDVVTGGASAVYGSDALAGVVNFRLRTDLDGLIAGAQYSITGRGDGARYNAYAAIGAPFADGRGNVTAYLEYFNRGQIMASDRRFSIFALGDNADDTGLIPLGSSSVPQGRLVAPGSIVVNGVTLPIANGTNYAGPLPGNPGGAFFGTAGISRPYTNAESHNYAPENFLMVPQERWVLGGFAEFELAEGINAYIEATYANNRVQNELAATPIAGNVDINLAAVEQHVSPADFTQLQTIAARQQAANAAALAAGSPLPFNNFTIGTTAQAGVPLPAGFVRLNVNQRVMQVGSRNTSFEQGSWRTLAGLRGDLTDSLSYDVYYLFARNRNSNIQGGNISRSAFNRLVADGTCNIFGANQLSAACVDQISILTQNTTISQLQVAQASVSGPLFTFASASEPVAFAAGLEWRSISAQFIPDTALSSGDVVGFNAGLPTAGAYNVKEAFAELRVPIVRDGFIYGIDLNGAARYSDYSLAAVGGVWTYAGGVEIAPIRDIALRAQYQRAVRAPNILDLFGGAGIGFPAATDPCALASAATDPTIRALCIATGVPESAVGQSGLQPNAQIQGRFSGNPDLEEEVSDTWTVGAVIRPSFIPRLNITIDYFDIKVVNAIAARANGVNNVLNFCYNVVQDVSSIFCRSITRNPLTGVIEGGPFVVDATNDNLGGLETSGVDLQVDYSVPLDFSLVGQGTSRVSMALLGTWTRKADFIPVAGLDVVNPGAGRFGLIVGEPIPRWRWSTRMSFIDGPVTASFRWRHTGAVRDDNDTATYVVERIGTYDLFDLSFAFDVSDELTLNLGVNNLFDREPPIVGANQSQSNTYPGTYDVIGRDFFVSANLRF